jgi:histidine ammonia-lyase
MTVILTGRDLKLADVVAVARRAEPVELAGEALARMQQARALADATREAGTPTYGLTTGLGVQKRVTVAADDAAFEWRQVHETRSGVGPLAPADVVRAAMVVFANQMAGGFTCLRPVLAERLVEALNEDVQPQVRSLGSLGASDLPPMADLVAEVFGGLDLAPGEGLALFNTSAFGTGRAALALADAARLVDAADVGGALALEGFAANLSPLHPSVERARPDPVLARTLAHLRDLLEGSYLWAGGAARNLQDPLTYRSTGPIQAAARTALEHATERLEIELRCAQVNPVVFAAEGAIRSASVYEVLALSAALDYVRAALAGMLVAATERSMKLLDALWSGLPTGLMPEPGPDLGLSILAITAESLTVEAASLASPVSFAVASSSGAEGIEDHATHLPLSARKLAEQVELGEAIVGIELLVAAQAVDTRGAGPLGSGTGAAHKRIRDVVAPLVPGMPPPVDVEPVRELIRAGAFV